MAAKGAKSRLGDPLVVTQRLSMVIFFYWDWTGPGSGQEPGITGNTWFPSHYLSLNGNIPVPTGMNRNGNAPGRTEPYMFTTSPTFPNKQPKETFDNSIMSFDVCVESLHFSKGNLTFLFALNCLTRFFHVNEDILSSKKSNIMFYDWLSTFVPLVGLTNLIRSDNIFRCSSINFRYLINYGTKLHICEHHQNFKY